MAVGDVYKLDLFQRYAGQRVMNSYYFVRLVATDPDQSAAAALAADWKVLLQQMQNAALTHESWSLQQVRGSLVTYNPTNCTRDGGLRYEGLHVTPFVGGNVGESLPPQSAIVVTLSTGMSGRSRRGRTYISAIGEAFQDAGTVTPAQVTAQQTNWTTQTAQFGIPGTDPNWTWGVWSNTIASGCKPAATHPHAMTNVQTGNPDGAFFPIIATKVRNIIYTQRRRTIGVGA